MTITFRVILPYVYRPWVKPCLTGLHPDLAEHVIEVDNTSINHGCAASWNIGARAVLDDNLDWLINLSPAVRFGPSGGRDMIDYLDNSPAWIVESEAPVGWHFNAWSRNLFERVGLFDENYWPAYGEDADISHRIRIALREDNKEDLWEVLDTDAWLMQAGHSSEWLGNISIDWNYHLRKWGGLSGQERYTRPFNDPANPLSYWPQPPTRHDPPPPPQHRLQPAHIGSHPIIDWPSTECDFADPDKPDVVVRATTPQDQAVLHRCAARQGYVPRWAGDHDNSQLWRFHHPDKRRETMGKWDDIAARAAADKATWLDDGHQGLRRGHGYMPVYEFYLSSCDVGSLLEIGVEHGGSLRAWKQIFPNAQILGIDINPDCLNADTAGAEVIIADAAKPDQLVQLTDTTFDIIIDDGSHRAKDIADSLMFFTGILRGGGFYMIEDVGLCGDNHDVYLAPIAEVLEAAFAVGLRLAGVYRSNLPFVTGGRYLCDFGLCVFRKVDAPGLYSDPV